MKKRVFFIAALAAAVFTSNDLNAQEDGGMRPAGGEKNIEVNFTPLGGAPISINTLRFRYFMSSDMAVRVGFSLSLAGTSSTTLAASNDPNAAPNTNVELESGTSTFGLTINPGIEKHFAQTDRLSPYVGAAINFSMTSSTSTGEAFDGSTTAPDDKIEGETTNGSTTFGVNLLMGADWYFSKHIYMGTEVGFGFAATSNADREDKNGGSGAPAKAVPPAKETVATPQPSSFNLGPNFNGAIRLGYLF
jgi:hypothetical protein